MWCVCVCVGERKRKEERERGERLDVYEASILQIRLLYKNPDPVQSLMNIR